MTQTTPDDEIVTAEACEILRKDKATLTRWVAAGKVVPTRKLPGVTGSYLFRRGDIETLRDEIQTEAAS